MFNAKSYSKEQACPRASLLFEQACPTQACPILHILLPVSLTIECNKLTTLPGDDLLAENHLVCRGIRTPCANTPGKGTPHSTIPLAPLHTKQPVRSHTPPPRRNVTAGTYTLHPTLHLELLVTLRLA